MRTSIKNGRMYLHLVWVVFSLQCLFALTLVAEDDDDECPPEMEDCITVTGTRVNCEDGAICSDGYPQNLSADCYKSIVGMDDPPVTSPYGVMRDTGPHNGIDLGVPEGTPVYAAKDGVVDQAVGGFPNGDRTTPNGNFVRINHDDGTEGVFLHLEKVSVAEGESVDAGDQIGTSNDTGSGTGSHLHYTEYRDQNNPELGTNDPALVHGNC